MRFDIRDYDDMTVMCCPTQEVSDIFLGYLDSVGKRWCSGESYLLHSSWSEYRENTCYAFNQGKYCSRGWYIDRGFQILEFDDFNWGDEPEDESELCISFADILFGTVEEE